MSVDPEVAEVVAAIPSWSGRLIRAETLGGGITNRNVRVVVDRESYVIRLPGKDTDVLGIDREAERRATEAAAAVGVAPEVYAFLADRGILITRFVEAEPLPPDQLEDRDVLADVVEAVRRIHAMGPLISSFDVFEVVQSYRTSAEERGAAIPAPYDGSLAVAERIRAAFETTPRTRRPCHNDLLNANFLRADGRIVIVDYEYAGMGDVFFDLGNLSINNGLGETAQEWLLQLYFGEPTTGQRARHKLMRIMSDLREAMWGVLQQGLSTLEFDYVEYAERHFARCSENASDDRFGEWLAAAGRN